MGQEAGREAGQVPGLVTLEVEAQAAGIFRLCVLGVLSTGVLSTEREPLGAGPAYCAQGPLCCSWPCLGGSESRT